MAAIYLGDLPPSASHLVPNDILLFYSFPREPEKFRSLNAISDTFREPNHPPNEYYFDYLIRLLGKIDVSELAQGAQLLTNEDQMIELGDEVGPFQLLIKLIEEGNCFKICSHGSVPFGEIEAKHHFMYSNDTKTVGFVEAKSTVNFANDGKLKVDFHGLFKIWEQKIIALYIDLLPMAHNVYMKQFLTVRK